MNSQKLRKKYSPLQKATVYFDVLSALNGLRLTKKQTQLLGWMAVEGNMYEKGNKKRFADIFDSSVNTVNKEMWKLKRMGFLSKENRHLKLHASFRRLDFDSPITLEILLENGQ